MKQEPILNLISEWKGKMLPIDSDMKFHHYGLACSDVTKATKMLFQSGYTIGDVVHDPLQKVFLSICTHKFLPCIEIVSAELKENPIQKIVEKKDMSIYHICYIVPERNKALLKLGSLGIRFVTVSTTKEAILFNGNTVSFHFAKEFDLFEILEKE
jgi:hypothetical protein